MPVGGFSSVAVPRPRPAGAAPVMTGSSAWRLGGHPVRVLSAPAGHSRVFVLGHCGASDFELSQLSTARLPVNLTCRWPGTYAVVEEVDKGVIVYTDPAASLPVYATRWNGCWAWSTSARVLAALTNAGIDAERLACTVFLPSVPTLSGSMSFFAGIRQLPPGSRVELPSNGAPLRTDTYWRPKPVQGSPPSARLRHALERAVVLRTDADPGLACDLSGGLDSTSISVLATISLPADRRLNAVTVHPDGDLGGADLHHARLSAARYAHRITHHLLPLTDHHLPYTSITAIPATDEPAPSTLTLARFAGQLTWLREKLGIRTHLTGDGGDSILFQPPIHLADLIRHGRFRRALGEAFGWARLRHVAVGPLLRDTARTSLVDRQRAMSNLAGAVGVSDRDDHGRVTWFPLLPFPTWGTAHARRLLIDAAQRAACLEDPLDDLDFSVRVLVDEIREVARTAVADAEVAAAHGIELHNPFLDPLVIDTVLSTPLDLRPPPHLYKPLLAQAMASLLPPETARRTTKGSFNADHYTGLRANLPHLSTLADGHLAGLGLVHPDRLRRHLSQAAAGLPTSLAPLEQAFAAEAWLTAHHHAPVPQWTLVTRTDEAHG
ncbi:albusnodin/ikarugamycin family macrolactam cyclase [Kitasatospora sp. NPDC008115]|uniref:albusnodin/ikarugamycin family macrolactam cyclase n=1 Tax=Kitasatospora sp. NPDC008115 TaxID=3364022 RepID=UPI0036E0CB49